MNPTRRLAKSLAARATQTPLISSSSRTQSFVPCRTEPFTTTRLSNRPFRPQFLSSQFCKHNSTTTREPKPLTDSKPATPEDAAQNAQRRSEERAFQITFTCKPCSTRSSHRISQHGYYKGTVLITCPGCKNRHVISDHLKIFMDNRSTLEDILAQKGQKLVKGKLEGDMEWWEDGTVRAFVPESEGGGDGQAQSQEQAQLGKAGQQQDRGAQEQQQQLDDTKQQKP
ncbi:hypothetical protein AJ79_06898 [Helicocarpus griseus UAMH5409]|uniref:DNL-type domain-containing protein n=1 Tax=Helicocarpus griseus UAMH5409 TaxID=1447875 RepID=A0A2B7X8F3_9EURO|nr:hypothetical protein AJ79_06898 [Helicocarpus griseus UAMH5409]